MVMSIQTSITTGHTCTLRESTFHLKSDGFEISRKCEAAGLAMCHWWVFYDLYECYVLNGKTDYLID